MTEPIQGLMPKDMDASVAQISEQGTGIDAITKLAVGNPHLVTNPGLLQALANGNATYQQASAINSFMAGLKLQQTVEHARATGTQYQFTQDEQNVLNNMGVKYSDVYITPQQQLQQAQAKAQAQGLTVATDASGKVIYGSDGTPLLTAKPVTPHKSGGGGFWHGVGSVMSDIAKPFQFVSSEAAMVGQGALHTVQDLIGGGNPTDPSSMHGSNLGNLGSDLKQTLGGNSPLAQQNLLNPSSSQAQDMRDSGYDPSSPFSFIAYQSSGKAYLDTSNLASDWNTTHPSLNNGDAMVEQAKAFIANPSKVTQGIETDPTLTPQQKAAQLGLLSSPEFQDLTARVASQRSDIGNLAALAGGVDPVQHPTLFRIASAGVDLAAGFAIDPVIVLGNTAKAAKLAQVGLKGFTDGAFSNRIADILLSDANPVTGAYKANVQRGMQRFIDNVNTIRDATTAAEQTAETARQIAHAYADIRATTPGLEPLISDFTGQARVVMDDAGKVTLDAKGAPIISKAAPITNMDEAAQYLGSKLAFARLMTGRAAVEWNLMPGALSAYGYRAMVRAPLAGVVGRNAAISFRTAEDAVKVLPWANDAIDENNRVVAAAGDLARAQQTLDQATAAHGAALAAVNSLDGSTPAMARFSAALKANQAAMARTTADDAVGAATTDLASARRAAEQETMLSGQLSGEVRNNLLRRGTLTGEGFNLGNYIAANAERAVRRLSTFLPRNMHITLTDASSADKIYKFMQFYASRSDAALAAAKWAAADEGTRRAMVVGIQQQVMHAAGYGASEAGRIELDRVSSLMDHPFSAADDAAEGHRYAVNGEDLVDDPVLGGKTAHMGVLPSHVEQAWRLPSFAELAKNAAQSVIWRRTFGPMFQSKVADLMTWGFKTFQLMKPSTWTRNMVEGLGNAAFRGELGAALRAKAVAAELGTLPERGNSRVFNPKNWGSIGDKLDQAMMHFAPLALVGQAYRHSALRMAGADDGIEYIARLSKPELEQYIHDYSTQHLRADLDPGGLLQARGIIDDGLTPSQFSMDEQHSLSPFRAGQPSYERTGFQPETADGKLGAQRWAGNLAQLVNEFPQHGKLLLDAVKADDGDVTKIVALMKDDPQLAARVGALRLRNLYQDDRLGTTAIARTAAERDIALEQLARRQVSIAKGLTTGRDGTYLDRLHDYIHANDKAPSDSWLMDNVKDENRPFQVLAPRYIARPPQDGVNGFVGAIAQVTDNAYQRLVEHPIHLTTSLPVFMANYGKARVFLEDAERETASTLADSKWSALDKSGMSTEDQALARKGIEDQAAQSADFLMKQQAVKMAWVRTEQIIDDPGLKTQLDMTGRNFFMYSRAVQAMIRRWGQAIMQDPTRLEKAALSLHAAEHAGMIYTDKNGQLSFVYPGSGALINGITKLASVIPGFNNFAQLPVTPDLTGKVLFAAPGLDNPFKLPLSPIVNIPYRMIEAHMPAATRLNMDEWDRFINGPIGAGQVGAEFMPAGLRNLFAALSPDDRKSQWASAMTSAISNLVAADPNGTKGIVPGPNASPAEVDAFLSNLKTQVKNVLAVRWALGLFTPAPASLPTMDTAGSKADPAFAAEGMRSLRDEYQQILNDYNGDYNQANQLWAAMHPDKLVFETSLSHSTAKGVSLPADAGTYDWIQHNLPFMEKYKASAAYFLPASQGAFDSRAYQEELALGIRQRYTPTEFYQQVRINQGGTGYWPSYDAYKARETELKAAGDTAGLTSLRDAWSQYSADYLAANPLFQNSLDASKSNKGNNAADVLANLRDMLKNPSDLPSTVPVTELGHMIGAYDQYAQWRTENKGGGSAGTARRNAMTAQYQAYMTSLAKSNPALQKLYNGVFRALSPELIDLSANAIVGG